MSTGATVKPRPISPPIPRISASSPQLIAGPIVRYSDVARELRERTVDTEQFSRGVVRFAVGLGKKVLLANSIGVLAELTVPEGSVLFSWLRAIAYTFQIYFDFAGTPIWPSGMGAMMGFRFPENFDYPYLSRSVTEFWRRWHMTLGGWFRDYVYIPLGGSRVSRWKWVRNVCCGLDAHRHLARGQLEFPALGASTTACSCWPKSSSGASISRERYSLMSMCCWATVLGFVLFPQRHGLRRPRGGSAGCSAWAACRWSTPRRSIISGATRCSSSSAPWAPTPLARPLGPEAPGPGHRHGAPASGRGSLPGCW